MSSPTLNEFPQKISRYFSLNGQVYPRGGVVKYGRTTVLVGATSSYIIGLRQNHDDLAVIKISNLDKTPIAPRNIRTVDELILYAYKTIFTPRYAEITKGNKTLAVGIIYSKFVEENRTIYWLYDIEENARFAVELVKAENISIKYMEIPEEELNNLIMKMFNFDGVKEILRFFLPHGLFTLDNYGE
jgi:hypothetical protein